MNASVFCQESKSPLLVATLPQNPYENLPFFSESCYLRLLSSVKAAILIPPSEEEYKNTRI